MEMTEGIISEGWIIMMEMMEGMMDCGEYQKDYGWLRNMIVLTIRKIIKDYDGDDGRNCIQRMDCGEYQKDNRWLRNRIVMEMTEGIVFEGWIVVNIRKMIGG